jgi:aminoglycoside phosphotransferase (APT) family kinase protein
MVPVIDEPGPVRDGEGLDADRLAAYLAEHLPGFAGPVEVSQFRHGHSNLTYLVRGGGRELVLRRPPFGNRVKSAHDMGREYHVLDRLGRVYPPAPRPLTYCEDESVLGAPFYVMERRRGVILRGGDAPAPEPPTLRAVSESLIESLAALHRIDPADAGLGEFGRPEGYVGRQVTGWARRYQDAKTDDLPDVERVAAWLDANRPGESGAAVVHNDFKFDNVLLDPADLTRVVAVLDWEMATVGDPLMDLGTTLGYWVEPGDPEPLHAMVVGPTTRPGCLTRAEVVARYEQATGRTVANALFYYVFGLFKIAVIVQQIYARYARGATADPRFARLGVVVAALGRGAALAVDSGKV